MSLRAKRGNLAKSGIRHEIAAVVLLLRNDLLLPFMRALNSVANNMNNYSGG